MSREIKFRVWYEGFQEMEYISDLYYFEEQGIRHAYEIDYLMQFTGLKDENGKEIYEGDIVKFDRITQNINDDVICEVKFNDDQCGFQPFCQRYDVDDPFYSVELRNIIVIGNIHENPELLKKWEQQRKC